MIKRILFPILMIFTSFLIQGQITLTTTSNNDSWSPTLVINSGDVLTWTAASNGVIDSQIVTANDPTFDFSLNTNNDPIVITITNTSNDFSGLTVLNMYVSGGGEITDIDLSQATALTTHSMSYNRLSTLDISQNTELETLTIRGNRQLNYQTLNTSANSKLTTIRIDATGINNVDLSNNDLLTNVFLNNARLPSSVLDQVVMDLDDNGEINGNLFISNNPGYLSTYAREAYLNLVENKGWDIDVVAPPQLNIQVITLTSNSTSNEWKPGIVDNTGDRDPLVWKAYNAVIGTLDPIRIDDGGSLGALPVFDFSSNDGTPIVITVTSRDGFAFFTRLFVSYLEISDLNISNATNLLRLGVRGNRNLGTVDLSTFPLLNRFIGDNSDLTNIDISHNGAWEHLYIQSNDFTSNQLDKVLNDLVIIGSSDGELLIKDQQTDETVSVASFNHYKTLVNNGWAIDIPKMNITGKGVSIAGDGANIPKVTDDTDFGSVMVGHTIIREFTIENSAFGKMDLNLVNPSPYVTITGLNASDFSVSAVPDQIINGGELDFWGNVITPPGFTTFEISYNSTNIGISNATISIASNDPYESNYSFNITAESTTISGPKIYVTGNGFDISSSNTALPEDGTDYQEIILGNSILHTFLIENFGDEDLTLTSLLISTSTDFVITSQPANTVIPAGVSEPFEVTFNPTSLGGKTGSVLIQSDNDPSHFILNIKGESVDVLSNQIMITQYYEGNTNTAEDSKWIEIKNISGSQIEENTYYLALFDNSQLNNISNETPVSEGIPFMDVDEVLLFRNNNATAPAAGNIGDATQIVTLVCNFTGDDVIVISTIDDATCFNNRVDMIGVLDPNDRWGGEKSFIRGVSGSELPNPDYDSNDWIELELNEVDNALIDSNIALGTQFIGVTTWNGAYWYPGLVDRTRNAVISSPYTANDGSIEVYNLIIDADLNFNDPVTTTNFVDVFGNLTINAPFTLGDEASLRTRDNTIISGNITKIENSTSLGDIYDTTFWSSPVNAANLGDVFLGVDPNRMFYLDGSNTGTFEPPYDHWFIADGGMEVGRGYSIQGSEIQAIPGAHTFSFTGVPNNSTILINAKYKGTNDTGDQDTGENDNFNLLGNPYPSAFSLDNFLTDTRHDLLEKTVYLWNHATENNNGEFSPADYGTYVLGSGGTATMPGGEPFNGYLASGQGFMIRTNDPSNPQQGSERNITIYFENLNRVVGDNSQFFKQTNSKKQGNNKNEKDRVWLNLTTEDGDFSQILIGFFDNATDGIDRSYDGLKLKAGNPITFYSFVENNKYVIQGLSSFNSDKTVAIGFDTEIAKTFIIGIDKTEGILKETNIYLVDNLLNITHDLKTSDYQFEQTTTGSFPDRFTLQFAGQALDVDDEIFAKNEFIISNDLESLKIRSAKEVKNIRVYDLLGRMLIQDKPNKRSFNLSTGSIKNGTVLIIEATLENGSVVSKKMIKY